MESYEENDDQSVLDTMKRDEDEFISDLLNDNDWETLKNYDISRENILQAIEALMKLKIFQYHSMAPILRLSVCNHQKLRI